MYITITGELGSGKSTVAALIKNNYDFIYYSTGTIQREIAKDLGITTLELNQRMTDDIKNEYDKMIDNKTIEIDKQYRGRNVIFDSRMAWHFVEKSFKVYVVVDIYSAACRVIEAGRGIEECYVDVSEAAAALLKRKQLEDVRFKEMYSVDTTDFSNYDLVVDSTDVTAEFLSDFIIKHADSGADHTRIYLSPKRLYPTKPVENMDFSYVDKLYNDPDIEDIDVVLCNGRYFIMDGHHRVCAKLKKGESLISVRLLNLDQKYIEDKLRQLSEEQYSEWEGLTSIKFNSYPQ